jgi:hypothetical protein
MSISIIISENYLQQVLFEILSLTMSIAIYPFRAVQNCILFFSSFFVIILRLNASSSTQRTFGHLHEIFYEFYLFKKFKEF